MEKFMIVDRISGYIGATAGIKPFQVSQDAIEVAKMKSAVIEDNKLYSSIVRNPKSFGANMITLFVKHPQEIAHINLAKNAEASENPAFKALEREFRLVKKISNIYFEEYKNSYKLREKLIQNGRISLDRVVPKMTNKFKKFLKYKF